MDLGTGLFTCQRRPDDDRSHEAIYDELLELGGAIDDAGLASAWASEHHFTDDGYLSGTMPALGALAAATDDVTIGTCIALAPLYDAVRLAEDAATVDLLSNGRLAVGCSIGYRDAEFENFGVPKEERVARTEETVDLLRGAWSEGPVGVDAEFHDIDPGTTVTPKPAGGPPIFLGGAARPAVRRAARVGDGWCAPSSLSLAGVRKRVEDIRRVRDEEGLDGEFQVYVLAHGFVGDSREDAWESMRDGYFYLQRRYAEWYEGEAIDELPEERRSELRDDAVFGTPDDVVAELERYGEALGDDVHVILRTYYPGIGTDAMVDCVERLGADVAPRL
ncbi:LLM class flavin-dependent oxidoreductase [Halosimplex pelagicum]|uniref:LLM class flavin-dependent oxidoreductase n=1 Tax=Halosimplex pelagicum TaxID=869886 RepID=A0A7D5TFV3_9EURY|nr:LLM class flavin-dependent oxidoreductase [Halosimplex pelagicum]QLH80876.1 LLM class flavin-dependent oxidoreductase [Halosimplex pelagicum]